MTKFVTIFSSLKENTKNQKKNANTQHKDNINTSLQIQYDLSIS